MTRNLDPSQIVSPETVEQAITELVFKRGNEGIAQIAIERQRQINQEGWTPEHDDEHVQGQLARAACCYAMRPHDSRREYVPLAWPWEHEWWKPSPDPIRNLVKAGALIAAEIDRLQRAKKEEAR